MIELLAGVCCVEWKIWNVMWCLALAQPRFLKAFLSLSDTWTSDSNMALSFCQKILYCWIKLISHKENVDLVQWLPLWNPCYSLQRLCCNSQKGFKGKELQEEPYNKWIHVITENKGDHSPSGWICFLWMCKCLNPDHTKEDMLLGCLTLDPTSYPVLTKID